eukprot:4679282-Prymnesium_polylepis.1
MTLETSASGATCTESHGSGSAPLVWQKLQSDALPHAPSMQASAEKSWPGNRSGPLKRKEDMEALSAGM